MARAQQFEVVGGGLIVGEELRGYWLGRKAAFRVLAAGFTERIVIPDHDTFGRAFVESDAAELFQIQGGAPAVRVRCATPDLALAVAQRLDVTLAYEGLKRVTGTELWYREGDGLEGLLPIDVRPRGIGRRPHC